MKILFALLGLGCFVVTIGAYEFNQTRRKDWIMDLAGVIGLLALLAMPIFFALCVK